MMNTSLPITSRNFVQECTVNNNKKNISTFRGKRPYVLYKASLCFTRNVGTLYFYGGAYLIYKSYLR